MNDDGMPLLPTPTAADASRGPDYARVGREKSGADDLPTVIFKLAAMSKRSSTA